MKVRTTFALMTAALELDEQKLIIMCMRPFCTQQIYVSAAFWDANDTVHLSHKCFALDEHSSCAQLTHVMFIHQSLMSWRRASLSWIRGADAAVGMATAMVCRQTTRPRWSVWCRTCVRSSLAATKWSAACSCESARSLRPPTMPQAWSARHARSRVLDVIIIYLLLTLQPPHLQTHISLIILYFDMLL